MKLKKTRLIYLFRQLFFKVKRLYKEPTKIYAMKTIFTLITFSISFVFSQNTISISQAEYQNLKHAGSLNPTINYSISDVSSPTNIKYNEGIEKNGTCDCMIPLDSTFTLAMLPNDDNSSEVIALPFTFNFYGNLYDSIYINNNGNISFVAPYSTWTAYSFPDSSYNMIAPFWADVDTRGGYDSLGNILGNGGNVWYKITPTALIVNWNQVGYFNMHSDLVSTFQLIISNGSDSIVSAGGNVSFCYQDMQWTTGDASSGINGFGGTPATVGVNIGNGTDFFQVGRFDQTGSNFDGPQNSNDGIDFLDGKEIYFNVAGIATSNTPPLLISSSICDTIDVYTGDTLKSMNTTSINIGIMTPEIGQTIEISSNSDAPNGAFSYVLNPINSEFYDLQVSFDATGVSPGIYHASITASDNGTPVESATKNFTFKVVYENMVAINQIVPSEFKIYPNPTNQILNITFNNKGNNKVQLHDLTGKQLVEKEMNEHQQLDLNNLTEGIYLITLYSNNEIIGIERIVKK